MDWRDERYVRIYVRDTASWLLGPWQARALLPLIARKLNRAGVMDLGEDGVEAIAALVHLPVEVVEPGLAWWIKRGTLKAVSGKLVMPNFLDAQEASANDAQRMRESRARARDKALAEQAGIVVTKTNDDSAKTNETVTNGHNQSLLAVPSLPSSTDPNQTKIPASPAPDSGESGSLSLAAPIRDVFQHWVTRQSRLTGAAAGKLKLTKDRETKIKGRLRDGYTVDELRRAIDGVFATEFNVERGFTDVSLVCRDGTHVDQYMAAAKPKLKEHSGVEREISVGKVIER